jgi:hypothetical protein
MRPWTGKPLVMMMAERIARLRGKEPRMTKEKLRVMEPRMVKEKLRVKEPMMVKRTEAGLERLRQMRRVMARQLKGWAMDLLTGRRIG